MDPASFGSYDDSKVVEEPEVDGPAGYAPNVHIEVTYFEHTVHVIIKLAGEQKGPSQHLRLVKGVHYCLLCLAMVISPSATDQTSKANVCYVQPATSIDFVA